MTYSKDHPVYLKLKHSIYSGEIAPGTHLKIGTLSQSFRTSTAPMREALVRLAAEDIVHYDFSHGYTVRTISYTELSDTFDLMELILVDALNKLDENSQQRIVKIASTLMEIPETTGERNTIDEDRTYIGKICRVLLSPVAERHFVKLAGVTRPFRTSIAELEHPDFPEKTLLTQLTASLQTGNIQKSKAIIQEYYRQRRETLPYFFEVYEQGRRVVGIS